MEGVEADEGAGKYEEDIYLYIVVNWTQRQYKLGVRCGDWSIKLGRIFRERSEFQNNREGLRGAGAGVVVVV